MREDNERLRREREELENKMYRLEKEISKING